MSRPYNLEEAAAKLRKTPRWLREWLCSHPADPMASPILRLWDAPRYYTTVISPALNVICEESLNAAHAQAAAPG